MPLPCDEPASRVFRSRPHVGSVSVRGCVRIGCTSHTLLAVPEMVPATNERALELGLIPRPGLYDTHPDNFVWPTRPHGAVFDEGFQGRNRYRYT